MQRCQHFPQDGPLRPLGFYGFGTGPEVQHRAGRFRFGQSDVGVDLRLLVQSTGLVGFVIPRQLRADVQHPQVVIEVRDLEIRHGDPLILQHRLKLLVGFGFQARQHEIRFSRQQDLGIGGFHRPQVLYGVRQIQVK